MRCERLHPLGHTPWLLILLALVSACGSGGGGTSAPPPTYSVGGTVSGLAGPGLELQNGSGTALSVAVDGTFVLPGTFTSGAAYAISVKTQPSSPQQICTVVRGSGSVGTSNVGDIAVQCATTITTANVAHVTSLTHTSLETLLQLASYVGERLSYLSGHLGATVSEPCSDPSHTRLGTVAYTYVDKDSSGTLSSGDLVTIDASSCASPSLGDYITGVMTVTLQAPPRPTDYAFGFGATANMNNFALTGIALSGALNITYTDSETKRMVGAQIGTPGFTMVYDGLGFFAADKVTLVTGSASKVVDYTIPQYQAQFAVDLRSDALKGEFTLTNTAPLVGRLGIFPTVGNEEFRGGVSVVKFGAQDISNNQLVTAALDANGSGTFDSLDYLGMSWQQGFTGFPWWEPHAGMFSLIGRPTYNTVTRDIWSMGLLYLTPVQDAINHIVGLNLDVKTPITLYFSGPVDSVNTSFSFLPPSYLSGPPTAADLTINGAIVHVKAHTQLEHGYPYLLSANSLSSTWGGPPSQFNSYTVGTNNNLQADGAPSPAVASPGTTVRLQSTRSFSTDNRIAAYAWQQTSGTPVALSDATTATASYVVPAAAQNTEKLAFQLTVTDANGETDSVPVTAFVLTDLTQPYLYYRQAQGAAVGLAPEMATLETPALGPIRTELFQFPYVFKFILSGTAADSLQLTSAPGATMAVGTYTNLNVPNIAGISIQKWPFMCNTPDWQFTVLSLAGASDGTAADFAADFSQGCPGGQPLYVGSVRVNNSTALP